MTRFAFLSFALAFGCSVDHTGLGPATDGGVDVGRPFDGGPAFDGGPGFDAGPRPDGGPRRDAGPVFDGGPGFDGGACTFTARCSADGLRIEECSGRVVSDKECPVRCDPAGPACLDLAPSNGLGEFLNVTDAASTDLRLAWPGAYEDRSEVWDTDNCEALPGSKGVHDPGGGVALCVLVFDDFRLQGMLRVDGSRGLAIVAQGSITIAANSALRLDGRGQRGGAGGGDGASSGTMAGGPHPGTNGARATWDDGGGGGGGNGANGGAGGNGDDANGGAGGTAAGGALDPVHGGSGGGAGGVGGNSGYGGGGGGVLLLVAREGVTLDGYLDVTGSAGFGGRSFEDANWGAGGGGGSGGSIVIETAGALTRSASGGILASGGGGGGGALCGVNGQDGRQELPGVVASGGDGAGCFGVSGGGGGGAGGEFGDGTRGVHRNAGDLGGNGGGGGGGPGLVVIRAQFPDTTPFGRSGIYQTGAPNYVVVE